MRALRRSLALAVVGLLLSLQSALAHVWTVEDGSQIRFTALQQGTPIEGRFERFTAAITFDPEALGKSLIEVEIDATSITTGHKDRDTALRSAAFFDVQRWPTARFRTLGLSHGQGDAYQAKAELTIRDVTKPVMLPFTLVIGADPGAPDRLLAQAKGELTISRLDYGVGQGDWASTKTVGEPVVIAIDIRASRPQVNRQATGRIAPDYGNALVGTGEPRGQGRTAAGPRPTSRPPGRDRAGPGSRPRRPGARARGNGARQAAVATRSAAKMRASTSSAIRLAALNRASVPASARAIPVGLIRLALATPSERPATHHAGERGRERQRELRERRRAREVREHRQPEHRAEQHQGTPGVLLAGAGKRPDHGRPEQREDRRDHEGRGGQRCARREPDHDRDRPGQHRGLQDVGPARQHRQQNAEHDTKSRDVGDLLPRHRGRPGREAEQRHIGGKEADRLGQALQRYAPPAGEPEPARAGRHDRDPERQQQRHDQQLTQGLGHQPPVAVGIIAVRRRAAPVSDSLSPIVDARGGARPRMRSTTRHARLGIALSFGRGRGRHRFCHAPRRRSAVAPERAARAAAPPASIAAEAPDATAASDAWQYVVEAGPQGHFVLEALVNGVPVAFLLDTGASDIVLTIADARRLGFSPQSLSFSQHYRTANGEVRGAPVRLRELRIGQFSLYDIDASVNEAPLTISLLGMEFLDRLRSYRVEDRRLILEW